MKYTILEVNYEQSWIKIEVTFDDGEKYIKRMMANVTNEDTIKAEIVQWLADYLPLREQEKQNKPKQAIVENKTVTIDITDLPKSSRTIDEEKKAMIAAQKIAHIKAMEDEKSKAEFKKIFNTDINK